jgi:hypothetical protein
MSDVDALHISPPPPPPTPTSSHPNDLDRFSFAIELSQSKLDLEKTVVCFCIRYQVDDREYWDNNNGTNYQVCFSMAPSSPERAGDDGGKSP